MKKNILVLAGSCLLFGAICAYAPSGECIPRTAKEAEEEEYTDIDTMLNKSAQQGKLAGEVDSASMVSDAESGGLSQQIQDTIEAQNELEND
ncbi:MAG: hypothetical protein HQ594_04710 [Candidatus Omnitrophica bacterium]|nr:hypothetical protein [Candidatus Omnitrophota bacterium]